MLFLFFPKVYERRKGIYNDDFYDAPSLKNNSVERGAWRCRQPTALSSPATDIGCPAGSITLS